MLHPFCCVQAAYTFDAGPNAVIYIRREHIPFVMAVLLNHFPVSDDSQIVTPRPELIPEVRSTIVPEALRCDADRVLPGAIGHVYHTSVRSMRVFWRVWFLILALSHSLQLTVVTLCRVRCRWAKVRHQPPAAWRWQV